MLFLMLSSRAGVMSSPESYSDRRSAAARCRAVVLLGEDAALLEAMLPDVLPRLIVDTMDAAVDAAISLAERGDLVLLSPACASFDMFSGFAERGDVFSDSVRRRLQEGSS